MHPAHDSGDVGAGCWHRLAAIDRWGDGRWFGDGDRRIGHRGNVHAHEEPPMIGCFIIIPYYVHKINTPQEAGH